MIRRRLVALTCAAGLVLAACGGDDDDDAGEPTATTAEPSSATTTGDATTVPDSAAPGTDASPSTEPDGTEPEGTEPGAPTTAGEEPAPAIDTEATVRTISTGPPPASWDPAMSLNTTQDVQFFSYVYDSLLRINGDAELEPHLATAWEYDDTRTVLTLTLRDDVTFTDGAPFDASVAKLNLDRVLTGTGAGARVLMGAGIQSIEAPSPTELVITQAAPSVKGLFVLASPAAAMASPLAIANPDSLAQTPVGTGPYTLEAVDASSATLVRNDDYWLTGVDFPARRIASGAVDGNARINAILSGQVDFAHISQTPPTPDLLEMEENGELQILTIPAQPSAIGVNNNVPPFDNPKVVQALNYALDRDTINEVIYNGTCTPVSQVFVEGQVGHIEGLEYEYDVDKARQLMEEAGVGEVTVKFQSVAGAPTTAIELYQSMFAEIGINLEVTASPVQEVFPRFFSGEFGMTVLATFLSVPDSSFVTDYLTGIQNPGTKAPELVELVSAANALDPEDPDRAAAYEAVNEYVFENPVYVPICQTPNTMVAAPNVVGIDAIPFSTIGGLDLTRIALTSE